MVREQLLDHKVEQPSGKPATMEEKDGLRAREPGELVELFSDDVWRFVSSQVSRREDAEDVVMEVFAVAVAKFHRLQSVDSQRQWLLAVARKKAADCLRRRYRRAERPIEAHDAVAEEPGLGERGEATRAALQSLPEGQGQALILKYVNGLSTEEVAEVIRRSVPATNSLLQRARGALRSALSPVFPDEVNR